MGIRLICGRSMPSPELWVQDVWICLICGRVGCGRYQQGHAVDHWRASGHCYSLELQSQRVWDYAGDGYVHRLVQSKTGGKLVEVPSPQAGPQGSQCGHPSEYALQAGLAKVSPGQGLDRQHRPARAPDARHLCGHGACMHASAACLALPKVVQAGLAAPCCRLPYTWMQAMNVVDGRP